MTSSPFLIDRAGSFWLDPDHLVAVAQTDFDIIFHSVSSEGFLVSSNLFLKTYQIS